MVECYHGIRVGREQGGRQPSQARVAFAEAVESFFDPDGLLLVDERHSRAEERFYWVGKSASGRVLTTRFTRRGTKIRIIGSAEWREFRRLYREKAKNH
jgi:uncharacterized DUF497 family protein